jgi:hypothetical protein
VIQPLLLVSKVAFDWFVNLNLDLVPPMRYARFAGHRRDLFEAVTRFYSSRGVNRLCTGAYYGRCP